MQPNDTQPTILVVNHDVWERRYTTDMLACEGYAVMGALNGPIVLRIAEKDVCDAIVRDLVLPEVTGVEVIQRLKAMDGTRSIPVIVVGEWPAGHLEALAGRIPKPLDAGRMISELPRCLRSDVQR